MTQPANPLPRMLAALTVDEFTELLSQHQPRPDESLTTAEAAQFLKIHPDHLTRLTRAGKVPAWKEGQAYRFSRRALEALVAGKEV